MKVNLLTIQNEEKKTTDNMENTSQNMERTNEESSTSQTDMMVDIERQKLSLLERMVKEQEKTNNRLSLIFENQKVELRNHDQMIDLLYRIAFNK